MNICFINPPNPFLANQAPFPPLGILYMARNLLNSPYENQEISVDIHDLATESDPLDKVSRIVSENYDIYGITSTTPQYPYALRIAGLIKKLKEDAYVVIGGVHPSVIDFSMKLNVPDRELYKKLVESFKVFDVIFKGEGEDTFRNLLDKPKWNNPLVINGGQASDINVFPARELVDMKKYNYKILNKNATQIMSARGCPFQCHFCCGRNITNLSRIRLRSIESTLAELDLLNSKYGYRAFFFHNDEFNISKKYTIELCKRLKERNYTFRAFVKAELFTEDMAKCMHDAGFVEIGCGIESGSQRILNLVNKHSTVEDNTRVAELCKKYDMNLKAFTMMGNLDETHKDIELTKKWLIDNKPEDFDLTIFTPYPGSDIFDNYNKFSDMIQIHPIDFTTFTTNYLGIPKKYECYVSTPEIKRDEFLTLREKIDEEVCNELGLVHKALLPQDGGAR